MSSASAPRIYLDNAATSWPKPDSVCAAVDAYQRASGMALLTTGTSLARLAGSILFGLLWTWRGVEFAVGLSTAVLAITILGGGLVLRRSREERDGRTATS